MGGDTAEAIVNQEPGSNNRPIFEEGSIAFERLWSRSRSALALYRRNLIERFFNKIKQCRHIATRYDKLAVTTSRLSNSRQSGDGCALMTHALVVRLRSKYFP
jgi:transposase